MGCPSCLGAAGGDEPEHGTLAVGAVPEPGGTQEAVVAGRQTGGQVIAQFQGAEEGLLRGDGRVLDAEIIRQAGAHRASHPGSIHGDIRPGFKGLTIHRPGYTFDETLVQKDAIHPGILQDLTACRADIAVQALQVGGHVDHVDRVVKFHVVTAFHRPGFAGGDKMEQFGRLRMGDAELIEAYLVEVDDLNVRAETLERAGFQQEDLAACLSQLPAEVGANRTGTNDQDLGFQIKRHGRFSITRV